MTCNERFEKANSHLDLSRSTIDGRYRSVETRQACDSWWECEAQFHPPRPPCTEVTDTFNHLVRRLPDVELTPEQCDKIEAAVASIKRRDHEHDGFLIVGDVHPRSGYMSINIIEGKEAIAFVEFTKQMAKRANCWKEGDE